MVHEHVFPDRPVRIIDPFGAGGGVDVIARALARRLAAAWGQPVIVENHPGGGSTAAPALVAHAPPDGYTLLMNTSAHAYSAARAGGLPYNPLRDFVPVAALTSQPYVLVACAQSGITTIDELAAAASDRPGEIRFASAGIGTGTHLAVAKLNRDLGIAAVHTPPAAITGHDAMSGNARRACPMARRARSWNSRTDCRRADRRRKSKRSRPQSREDQPAIQIDAEPTPRVRRAPILPRVSLPGVEPELPRLRDGVEPPHLLAVCTSNARISPGAASPGPSSHETPTMIVSCQITGADVGP